MNFNATLIGQLITFAIFVWFTMKFVWPLLQKQMHDREKRIADGLASAEMGKEKLVEAEKALQQAIDEGKQKAAEIIAQAQKRSGELIEEAKDIAKAEAERVKASAYAELAQEKAKAREELKAQVATLAVVGAEKILMKEINQEAHNDILSEISSGL